MCIECHSPRDANGEIIPGKEFTGAPIDRDGRQLRPPMPRFRMTLQDAADVVAYLKSL